MDRIWAFVIDILVAIVIVFVSVAIYFGLRTEAVMKTLATGITEDFLMEVKQNGYMSVSDYEGYMNRLSLSNALLDMKLEHVYKVHEPVYRLRTVEEIIAAQEASYTGENIYHYRELNTDKPVVENPVYDGSLNTDTNESILAGAVDTPASPSHVHTEDCYVGHRHSKGSCSFEADLRCSASDAGDFILGSREFYKRFYCTNCNGNVAELVYSESQATMISFWNYSSIYMRRYVNNNGSIYMNLAKDIGMYDIMDGNGPNPGQDWYHLVTEVDFGFGTISINQYRKYNPEWIQYLNAFWYVNANGISETYLSIVGFDADWICPYCGHHLGYYSCGNTEDTSLDCSQQVISLVPTNPVQTVATGDPLITTAAATYCDGSEKTIVCTTDFSTANVVQNQTAVLTYSYTIDGIQFSADTSIAVTVIPRQKTCSHGHTYNLNTDGTDSGCPFCKAWVKDLRIVHPTTSTLTITLGTTLQQNKVTLLATYYDGHTETVSSGYEDNLDNMYLGTKPVTIGYKGEAVQLMVTAVCAKMVCDICGYEYNLYPDFTNPGCPRCISQTPVFTGNIITYEEAVYTEGILEELYIKGTYEFSINDTFIISLKNRSDTIARRILSRIYPAMSNRWFTLRISDKIGAK